MAQISNKFINLETSRVNEERVVFREKLLMNQQQFLLAIAFSAI
jgi:hypothetical protein